MSPVTSGAPETAIPLECAHRLMLGDPEALAQIFRIAGPAVYRLAWRIVRDRQTAEDLTQDAFVRLFEARSSLDPARSVKGLLMKMTANLAIDHLRRERRHVSFGEYDESGDAFDPGGRPNADEIRAVDRATLDKALAQLPEIYRVTLSLRYAEAWSYREIAEILEISVPAVALRLLRGKTALRTLLAPSESQS